MPWVLLILLWTVELFLVQAASSGDEFKVPEALLARKLLRFGLDLAFVTLCVLFLPRWMLVATFAAGVLVYVLGGVYFDHYGRLPRVTLLLDTGEGLAFGSLILDMVQPRMLALFCLLAVAKTGLLLAALRHGFPPSTRIGRRRVATAALSVYLICLMIGQLVYDPFGQMRRWGSSARFAVTYGFTLPVLVETYQTSSSSLLKRALENGKRASDRLTPAEAGIPVRDRLVFLQVESLDWGLMGHMVNGQPVIPNLDRLRRASMVYRVEMPHRNGSADADFVSLMGKLPSPDLVTYKIADYPYAGALPQRLRALGYKSTAVHGVSGHFFNRREGFEKMGFDRLVFAEELLRAGVAARHDRYPWVQDAEMLEFAARDLAASRGRVFQHVITVTSHAPFAELPQAERAQCPRWDDMASRYFCSMRYVDRHVGRYLDALPPDTTVLVYGDHNSTVSGPGYDSGRRGDRDFVPALIHDTSQDLSRLQRSGAAAIDGSLGFVDVVRYLFSQIDRKRTTVPDASASSAETRRR